MISIRVERAVCPCKFYQFICYWAHSVNSKAGTSWLTVIQKTYGCDLMEFLHMKFFHGIKSAWVQIFSNKNMKMKYKKRKEEQETLAIDANILFQYWLFHGRNSYNLCKLIFSPYSGWSFWRCSRRGAKWYIHLSHISYNVETWHSHTLT